MPATDDWTRPHWTRDEARAMLLYFVYGAFAGAPGSDPSARTGTGLPQGVELQRIPRAMLAHWEGNPLRGALGEILREGDRAALDAARRAPECMMLRGELPDQASLGYLRDTLGVVTTLLDAGGVAVVDPQILEIHSAADWRSRHADGARFDFRSHVAILCSDAGDGAAWVHTRGLRKFARPDIGIRRVPQAAVQRAGAVAARIAELEVRGMRFGDGSTVDVEGEPGGLRVSLAGSLDDPGFNNTHLELAWPES